MLERKKNEIPQAMALPTRHTDSGLDHSRVQVNFARFSPDSGTCFRTRGQFTRQANYLA